ncbi:Bifunctional heparan sulfate N-deacetylase/N-sulfotransferase, partial [Acromyrmex echinatior]
LIHRDTRPEPAIRCSTLRGATRLPSAPDHRSEARLRIDPKVLVFVETLYSRLGREIAELLVYNRIKRVKPDLLACSPVFRIDLIQEKRFHPSDLKVGRQRKLSSEFSAVIVHTIRQKVYG